MGIELPSAGLFIPSFLPLLLSLCGMKALGAHVLSEAGEHGPEAIILSESFNSSYLKWENDPHIPYKDHC